MRRNSHLQKDSEIVQATLLLREPFARWDDAESFDTAAECKQAQRQRYLAAFRLAPDNPSPLPEGKPDFLQRLMQRLKARWKYIRDGRTTATEFRFVTPWDLIETSEDVRTSPLRLTSVATVCNLRSMSRLSCRTDQGPPCSGSSAGIHRPSTSEDFTNPARFAGTRSPTFAAARQSRPRPGFPARSCAG